MSKSRKRDTLHTTGSKVYGRRDTAPLLSVKSAVIRTYRDNGQSTAYIEWSDGHQTEGPFIVVKNGRRTFGAVMRELLKIAKRQGVKIRRERW